MKEIGIMVSYPKCKNNNETTTKQELAVSKRDENPATSEVRIRFLPVPTLCRRLLS